MWRGVLRKQKPQTGLTKVSSACKSGRYGLAVGLDGTFQATVEGCGDECMADAYLQHLGHFAAKMTEVV